MIEKLLNVGKTTRQRTPTCGLNRVSRLNPESNSGSIHIIGPQAKARECLARIVRGRTIDWVNQRGGGRKPRNIIATPALLRFHYNQRLTDCYSSRVLHHTVATPCSH